MRRLWIIAHYDRAQEIAGYVMSMLRAYRALGGDVVLVSAGGLTQAARRKAGAVADQIVERENAGLDFASWRAGLEQRDMGAGYDEIVIANDSVYGPFADISGVLARLARVPILGLSISRERALHIQSYFIGFNMRAFPRALFERFWCGVVPLGDKDEIIRRYEIGLSQQALAAGVELAAVFDARRPAALPLVPQLWRQIAPERADPRRALSLLRAQLRRASNPTMFHWYEMMRAGAPYAKVELLRDNPIGLNRALVLRAIARYGARHVAEIAEHLASPGGGR